MYARMCLKKMTYRKFRGLDGNCMLLIINYLYLWIGFAPQKKGDLKFRASLAMLLKTHVEKIVGL